MWVLSLPFYAGYMYMYRVFAALRSFLKFALIDFAVRFVQVAGYWYLCQPDVLGLAGIPVADLGFYAVMFVVCSFIVRGKVGSYGNRSIVVMVVKTVVASVVGAVAAGLLANGMGVLLAGVAISAVVKAVAILAVSGVVGLVVSFGLCKVLRVEEFAVLSRIGSKFARKLGRGKKGNHAA